MAFSSKLTRNWVLRLNLSFRRRVELCREIALCVALLLAETCMDNRNSSRRKMTELFGEEGWEGEGILCVR